MFFSTQSLSRFIGLFLIIFSFFTAKTQTATQNLRGRVVDATSGKALMLASVMLDKPTTQAVNNAMDSTATIIGAAVTDSAGYFVLQGVRVGRHTLKVGFVGYEKTIVQDIYVESGKETVLEIGLKPSEAELETVVVATSSALPHSIHPSVRVLEKTRFQFPATFSDPARYASFAAGASVDNDQANGISIRGISPNAMQWYVEGAEILNPNHLSNAGTLTDRASANAGGVMAISANVLDNTTFFAGSTPSPYANALAGGLDMALRKGNSERRQTSFQAGLLGFDLATEGGFSKKSKVSYLLNYRYSFTGLLGQFGIDFGGEKIDFQDFNAHFHIPTKKIGEFSVFAMIGASNNIFTHKPRTDWQVDKDSQDINYNQIQGYAGFKHKVPLSKNLSWQTVAVYSYLDNDRQAIGFGANDVPIKAILNTNDQAKYFVRTSLNGRFKHTNWQLGGIYKQDKFDARTTDFSNSNLSSISTGTANWLIGYADISGNFGKKWAYQVGARSAYFVYNEQFSFEPSANLRYNFSPKGYLQAGYGRQSQFLTPELAFRRVNFGGQSFGELGLVFSDNISLTANYRILPQTRILATVFWQNYYNIKTLNPSQSFPISYLEGATDGYYFVFFTTQTANSSGVSLQLQQDFTKNWFGLVNATFFDANINGRSLAFNSKYMVNALIGREFALGKTQNRVLGISTRSVLRGGNFAYNFKAWVQVKDYFRQDLNIYLKTNHKKWHSTIQIDIQNLTSRQNEWSFYFDRHQNRVLPFLQLGMVPNASYKIEF